MKQIRTWLPYAAVILLNFYVLPNFIQDTGTAVLMLLLVMPAICLVSAAVYGLRHPFHIFYPVSVAVLFLPAVCIFYNDSALVYAAVYGVVALLGNLLGRGIARLLHQK